MRDREDGGKSYQFSKIWTQLNIFTAWLYDLIARSFFGRAMRGYTVLERETSRLFGRVLRRKRGGAQPGFLLPKPVQNFFARSLERSFAARLVSGLRFRLERASLHSFGAFLMFSFIGTIFSGFLHALIETGAPIPSMTYIIFSAILFLSGGICLTLRRYTASISMGMVFKNSWLHWLFRGLGITVDESASREGVATPQIPMAFGFATVFTALVYFLGPVQAVLVAVGVWLAFVVIDNPETGVILITFFAPLLIMTSIPTPLLIGMLLLTAVSFLIKVLTGRRQMHFKLFDLMVLLWGVAQLIGGINSYPGTDSALNGVQTALLLLGYFLTVNLIRNRAWIERMLGALLTSAFLVGIVTLLTSLVPENWIDILNSTALTQAILNVQEAFRSPQIMSMNMILVLPLCVLFLFKHRKRILSHAFAAVLVGVLIYALIYSWTRSAWLGALISLLVMVLLIDHRALSVVILALPVIALGFTLLLTFAEGLTEVPMIKRFLSILDFTDDSVRYRLEVWGSVMRMIRDNLLTGIGVGQKAFMAVYPSYAAVGTVGAEHTYMLYLQIWAELGIVGLILFAILMVMLFQKAFEFMHIENDSFKRKNVIGGICGILAFLLANIFDYGWYSLQLYFMFWLMVGFICANIRAGIEEREANELIGSQTSNFYERTAE